MDRSNSIGTPLRFALAATLALCLVRLWLMPLPSSLWVDEMGTAFVVQHGGADPSMKAAPQVAESVYYALPKLAVKIAGPSEVAYRFFSVLAMLGALLAIAGIASRLLDRRAAWLAVFGCLAVKPFNYEAADARPYALGTLVLTVALYLLIRWMDSGRVRDGLLFAAAAALLWWVHLIFWPFYILFAAYAGFCLITARTKVPWWQAIGIFALTGAAILPVALTALALLHQARAHVIVPPPTFRELTQQLNFNLLTGGCALAFLVSRARGWEVKQPVAGSSAVFLIAGWWLMDPLVLFVFSKVSGESVFVGRYMSLALPGAALTVLLLVAMSIPREYWNRMALALGVGVLIFSGHWGSLWPPHHNSDWRGAAAALHNWTGGADVPVICPSPFIEARPPEWKPDYPITTFLYSNLTFYPTSGRVYPFPFETSPKAEAYARELAQGTLSRVTRFAIYGGDQNVKFWREWFARRRELEGWNDRLLGTFGDVRIVVFTAPGLESAQAGLRSPK